MFTFQFPGIFLKRKQHYWSFYWPLALMGVSLMVADFLRNGTLGRYPDAASELATFAIASSIYVVTRAGLNFVPQMTTVYCRSKHACYLCFRFVMGISLILSLPLFYLGFTSGGRTFIQVLFSVEGQALNDITFYLAIMIPAIFLLGLRNYWTGLLIQACQTRSVTLLDIIFLGTVLLLLWIGLVLGWPAIITMAISEIISLLMYCVLGGLLVRRKYRSPAVSQFEQLTYREVFRFFWPVALTSSMLELNKPIVYGFVSRTPEALNLLATMRVSFNLGTIFFNPINQFRHLYVTFGADDPKGVRNFMIQMMAVILLIMVLIAATPLKTIIFRDLLGVTGPVLEMCIQAFWVFCLIPLVMSFRNYFHGQALVSRTTGRIGIGSVLRTIVVFLACWILQTNGWMNAYSAAAVIVFGFLVEAILVMLYTFGLRKS